MDATTEKFLESVSRDLYYIANAQLCAKITCRLCGQRERGIYLTDVFGPAPIRMEVIRVRVHLTKIA